MAALACGSPSLALLSFVPWIFNTQEPQRCPQDDPHISTESPDAKKSEMAQVTVLTSFLSCDKLLWICQNYGIANPSSGGSEFQDAGSQCLNLEVEESTLIRPYDKEIDREIRYIHHILDWKGDKDV
eukprot:jgi/Bigna1/128307/aug1.6_g3015